MEKKCIQKNRMKKSEDCSSDERKKIKEELKPYMDQLPEYTHLVMGNRNPHQETYPEVYRISFGDTNDERIEEAVDELQERRLQE